MIKIEKAINKYKEALKDMNDVSLGGKDYGAASFGDISIRMDREEKTKKKLIKTLGEHEFKKLFKEKA